MSLCASIIYEYRDGASAEMIQQDFPSLSIEQVNGAIDFYLGNPDESERYLRRLEQKWEDLRRTASPINPELHQRLDEARKRLLAKDA